MKELTLTIPNALSEITLEQFISLFKGNIVEALGLDDETVEYIPFEVLNQVVKTLSTIPMIPSGVTDHFAVEGKLYFINKEILDMTFEEGTILDKLQKDNSVDDLHKFIALYTRPVKLKRSYTYKDVKRQGAKKTLRSFRAHGGMYVPKAWNRKEYEERAQTFLEKMPADVALWISTYFTQFGIEILKAAANAQMAGVA